MKTNGTSSSTAIVKVAPAQMAEPSRPTEPSPQSWPDMVAMGDALVRTRMLPEHVRDGASAALIILTGRELGMAPMRSLRSLTVVKGKVIESADSQLARFKSDGGHAEFRALDDAQAVLWLRHPNGDEHIETWTIADRKLAGLGAMHEKFPRAMNRSRCITAGLKSIGWEGGVGTYDPDEARSFSGQVEQPTAAQAKRRVIPAEEDTEAPSAMEEVGQAQPSRAPTAVVATYRPDAVRRARMVELLAILGVDVDRRGYLLEAGGGSLPDSERATDALIAVLKDRAGLGAVDDVEDHL